MRISKALLSLAAVGTVIAATSATAHHSFAMFDANKTVKLSGTIKEFQWMNPHSWVELVVRDRATGKDVAYSIETWGAGSLSRQGFKRTSMKPGDKADLVIHPLKDGRPGGQLVSVAINGQKVGTRATIQDKVD